MNSILESQESLSDFKKSINLVSNKIEEVLDAKIVDSGEADSSVSNNLNFADVRFVSLA